MIGPCYRMQDAVRSGHGASLMFVVNPGLLVTRRRPEHTKTTCFLSCHCTITISGNSMEYIYIYIYIYGIQKATWSNSTPPKKSVGDLGFGIASCSGMHSLYEVRRTLWDPLHPFPGGPVVIFVTNRPATWAGS